MVFDPVFSSNFDNISLTTTNLLLCEAEIPVEILSISICPVSLSNPTCIKQKCISEIANLASFFRTFFDNLILADASANLIIASNCLAEIGIGLISSSGEDVPLFLSST